MMTPNRSCGRILVATLVAIYFIGLAHWALAESAAHSTAATAPGASDESISKESSGASQETAINPLEFKTDLALWTAVVFLLLLAVLWKFAWGPLAEGLDKRERISPIRSSRQTRPIKRPRICSLTTKKIGRFAERGTGDFGKRPSRRRPGRTRHARKGQGRRQG